MRFGYAARTAVGLAVIVALGMLSAVHMFASAASSFRRAPDRDPTSEFVQRFERVRGHLPPHGVVGYLTDEPKGIEEKAMSLQLAQYALTPVIVVWGADRDLVVGDFSDPAARRRACESGRLTLLRDFGNGLVLLGRMTE